MKPIVRFSSVLPKAYREKLERLVFFNEQQHKIESALLRALERYGTPKVTVDDGGHLRFTVRAFPAAQSLYAFDDATDPPTLAAAAIYSREGDDTLVLLFLAIHEAYAAGGEHAGEGLGAQLIEVVRANAARTKGVQWLRLLVPKDMRISVRPRGGR